MAAWKEFSQGKRKKKGIAEFEFQIEDNIFHLHQLLIAKAYRHDVYENFSVCDPKRRHIHKASVRDRILHQAIFRVLYPIFDKHFIDDSYSSREFKGTHKGVVRLMRACRKVSKNWRAETYVLKCDIRKFFDSIDHRILRELIVRRAYDPDMLWLIDEILRSFEKSNGKGLPLGNVTSQLFANIYLNELDQFAKHELKAKHYFRYCDDFIIVHAEREFLRKSLEKITCFLYEKLLLELHPKKVEIRKVRQGVDFLGYVISPHVTVLRTSTKRRLLRKLSEAKKNFLVGEMSKEKFKSTIVSYLGVLSHCRNASVRWRVWKMLEMIDSFFEKQ